MEKQPEAEASPKKLDASMELAGARLEGVHARIDGLETSVLRLGDTLADLTETLGKLSQLSVGLAETVGSIIKTVRATAPSRKVWVVDITGREDDFGPVQVMIEQFDDKPPAVAFRPHSGATWGRPHQSVVG